MSKPAALNRIDVAKAHLLKLVVVGLFVIITSFLCLPTYAVFITYGVCIFCLANLFFAVYAFRYTASKSAGLMLRSFSRGMFLKMAIFAIGLVAVFKFDVRAQETLQVTALFAAFVFMQISQMFLATQTKSNSKK